MLNANLDCFLSATFIYQCVNKPDAKKCKEDEQTLVDLSSKKQKQRGTNENALKK